MSIEPVTLTSTPVRTVDGGLQQRGRKWPCLRGLLGLVLAGGAADAHVGKARVLHDGGHVGKIEVDEARVADQVGDALHRLTQYVVRDLECVGKGDLLVGRMLEALVRDDDQRVDLGLELFDARFRLRHAAAAFKTEGLRHDADGQDARLARDLGNNGRAARAGAAAHASGDEDHIGVLERLGDLRCGSPRRSCGRPRGRSPRPDRASAFRRSGFYKWRQTRCSACLSVFTATKSTPLRTGAAPCG